MYVVDYLYFSIDNEWEKKYFKSLLATQQTTVLNTDQQQSERNKAFDLLDALTKSGMQQHQ